MYYKLIHTYSHNKDIHTYIDTYMYILMYKYIGADLLSGFTKPTIE